MISNVGISLVVHVSFIGAVASLVASSYIGLCVCMCIYTVVERLSFLYG